ncbi:MAG: GyrI-like domain-containing protein [Planctomycetota bacterium]|jgi:effector-binding domain-containing protein
MSKLRTWLLLLAAVAVLAAGASKVVVEPAADQEDLAIRQVGEQVVLYTLYRGSYDKTGQTIGKLYALAGRKGIAPGGPMSCAYLNNPTLVSSEHWLTEIRIPVGKDALKLAGTLGEFTDVKTLPAMKVVVAEKREGIADPGPLYEKLAWWIPTHRYHAIGAPYETFLTGAESGDYTKMKSQIMIPVKKQKEPKQP